MDNQLDTNVTDPDPNNSSSQSRAGRDDYNVSGTMVGSVVGGGSVHANNIAGGDIVSGPPRPERLHEFHEALGALRGLIVEAKEAGELTDAVAQKTLSSLDETAKLIQSEGQPPKEQILRRLEYVADALDTAVDMFTASGAADVLLRAAPVASLLIKIAGRIF